MKSCLKFTMILALVCQIANGLTASGSAAFNPPQQGVAKGPIGPPDAELEKQSYRNLEVAKFYFYKRKPDKNDKDGQTRINKAVESRLMEIMDTNSTFARMDDVYFMLGELYHRMENHEKAIQYWNKAAKETSDEKIKSEVQKRLDESKNKEKN